MINAPLESQSRNPYKSRLSDDGNQRSLSCPYSSRKHLIPNMFQGFVFNFVDEYEFSKYLEKRYGWKTEEIIVETHYIYPE